MPLEAAQEDIRRLTFDEPILIVKNYEVAKANKFVIIRGKEWNIFRENWKRNIDVVSQMLINIEVITSQIRRANLHQQNMYDQSTRIPLRSRIEFSNSSNNEHKIDRNTMS